MLNPNQDSEYKGIVSTTADGEVLYIPTEDEREHTSIKVKHVGNWDPTEYHHPKNQHQDRLKEVSEKRQIKPVKRKNSAIPKPKPATKLVDMSTGKKRPIDLGVEAAKQKDLSRRGLNTKSKNNDINDK